MASGPEVLDLDLPTGRFRALRWPGGSQVAVFLHGLGGMADVWDGSVRALRAALGSAAPTCVALDQRGHGRSDRTPGRYAVGDYVGDLLATIAATSEGPVHLVGHSMGARVSLVAAAKHPARLRSVVIVDIGPEQWRANIERTSELFGALPESFADREAALAFGMAFGRGEAAASSFVDDRLRAEPDGSHTWLAARSALIETVTVQRARNYWGEWEAIGIPALLVRGGTSNELRPHVTEAMRRRNPTVSFVELEGVGHNIPLLAPDRLGESIVEFWRSLA